MDLFDGTAAPAAPQHPAPGLTLLRGHALPDQAALCAAVRQVIAQAPLRHMVTRTGLRMSVAMSNCGSFGWISDRRGYSYAPRDPDTGLPWPPLPPPLAALAARAAALAGFPGFLPDACLVNRYVPGARMSLHQDRNERDFSQPIVSVSLGVEATFLFGGAVRSERPLRLRLVHGDVLVWGGVARLNFHGVSPLRPGWHDSFGEQRINLTLRRA